MSDHTQSGAEPTDVPEFTVDRRTWARGGKNGASMLLNAEGCRCCLGFYAGACGVEDILYQNTPRSARGWNTKLVRMCTYAADGSRYRNDTAECETIMVTNDAVNITEDDCEARLTEQFAAIGITVRFVGPREGEP